MQLDVRTILFMTLLLTFIMSGVVAMTGRRRGGAYGVREWAAGNLSISLALSLGSGMLLSTEWLLVVCNVLVALGVGVGLMLSALWTFKRERKNQYFPFQLALLVGVQNAWLVWVVPNITVRIALNSLVYGLACLAGTRLLLRRHGNGVPLADGFTGLVFAAFAAVLLLRAISVFFTPLPPTPLLTSSLVGGWTFLAAGVMLLCTTFGFILMLNEQLADELERLATHDGLTGLLNRRGLLETGEQMCAGSARSGHSVAVMMADMDYFKSINDRHGHLVGDAVLRRFAELARQTARAGDCIGRYGGEEFCIVLPATSETEARHLAERLRGHLADSPIQCGDLCIHCTLSIGVTDSQHSGFDFNRLLDDADRALYQAKHKGRNQVVVVSALAAPQAAAPSIDQP